MSRFVVDLGNMKLTEADRDAIASAIQQAVLAQLAAHHAAPAARAAQAATAASPSPNYVLNPIKWRGQIWRPLIDQLQQAENQIESFANAQVP
jgi:hypothetical protein